MNFWNMREKHIYLAGIIDGEGSISIEIQNANKTCRKTDYYSIRLLVINTSKSLMDWLIQEFGGSLYKRKLIPNQKQCYKWEIFSFNAALIIEQIQEFLIIKKRHAEILLEFLKTKPKDKYFVSKEVQDKRRLLYQELKQLTKTGC